MTLPPHTLPPATAPIVPTDTPCRQCSYNLRGLPMDNNCPECGMPVQRSIGGILLRNSHPGYVRTLHAGTRLILWGLLVLIVGAILAGVMAAISSSLVIVAGLVAFGGYVMTLVGSWKLTEPDPSGLGEDEYGTARRIVRIALLIGIGSALLSVFREVANVPPAVATTLQVIEFVVGIISVIGIAAQLYYFKQLALRIPDFALSDRAKVIMYGFTICYAIQQTMAIIMVLSMGGAAPNPGAGFAVLGCGTAIAGIALLVFSIMYLLLLFRFNKHFRQEGIAAEQNWRGPAVA